MSGGLQCESIYRIDVFHQFLPNRGSTGKGLVQFFGPRARRRYQVGKKKPKWEVGPANQKHTVEVAGEVDGYLQLK